MKKIRVVKSKLPKSHIDGLSFEVSKKPKGKINNQDIAGFYDSSQKKVILYPVLEDLSEEEANGIITHEVGHYVYFKKLSVGDRNNYAKIYREDKKYPSDYGKLHPDEDFAESYRLYYTDQKDKLSERRKKFFDEKVGVL